MENKMNDHCGQLTIADGKKMRGKSLYDEPVLL